MDVYKEYDKAKSVITNAIDVILSDVGKPFYILEHVYVLSF